MKQPVDLKEPNIPHGFKNKIAVSHKQLFHKYMCPFVTGGALG